VKILFKLFQLKIIISSFNVIDIIIIVCTLAVATLCKARDYLYLCEASLLLGGFLLIISKGIPQKCYNYFFQQTVFSSRPNVFPHIPGLHFLCAKWQRQNPSASRSINSLSHSEFIDLYNRFHIFADIGFSVHLYLNSICIPEFIFLDTFDATPVKNNCLPYRSKTLKPAFRILALALKFQNDKLNKHAEIWIQFEDITYLSLVRFKLLSFFKFEKFVPFYRLQNAYNRLQSPQVDKDHEFAQKLDEFLFNYRQHATQAPVARYIHEVNKFDYDLGKKFTLEGLYARLSYPEIKNLWEKVLEIAVPRDTEHRRQYVRAYF